MHRHHHQKPPQTHRCLSLSSVLPLLRSPWPWLTSLLQPQTAPPLAPSPRGRSRLLLRQTLSPRPTWALERTPRRTLSTSLRGRWEGRLARRPLQPTTECIRLSSTQQWRLQQQNQRWWQWRRRRRWRQTTQRCCLQRRRKTHRPPHRRLQCLQLLTQQIEAWHLTSMERLLTQQMQARHLTSMERLLTQRSALRVMLQAKAQPCAVRAWQRRRGEGLANLLRLS
jgi:hypothetical protein